MGMLTSLLVLSFLIFIHELGHFLAARYFGVKVEVFSIGFGKKIFSRTKGDTEYCLSMIPLGGYVKMKGQEDLDPLARSGEDDSYNTKHPLQRLVILFAGPFANFLTAFVLYFAVATSGMQILEPIIGDVIKDSPAKLGGLQKGDAILDIDGQEISKWEDISVAIKSSQSESLDIIIFRDGVEQQLFITPKILSSQNIFGETIHKKMLGIAPSGDTREVTYSLSDSLYVGYDKTVESGKLIFLSILKLVQGVISPDNVGGIVSIVDVTAKASEMGITALMLLTALISVNLGVLNLLPIPALDGGHMVFVIYEFIFKKPPRENILYRLTIMGWILLGGVMFLGLYNDINRLFLG